MNSEMDLKDELLGRLEAKAELYFSEHMKSWHSLADEHKKNWIDVWCSGFINGWVNCKADQEYIKIK